jgi:hypothetical protein
MDEKKRKEFKALSLPLMKFLNDNCNPHTIIIIDTTRAELLEGQAAFSTEEYVKD